SKRGKPSQIDLIPSHGDRRLVQGLRRLGWILFAKCSFFAGPLLFLRESSIIMGQWPALRPREPHERNGKDAQTLPARAAIPGRLSELRGTARLSPANACR